MERHHVRAGAMRISLKVLMTGQTANFNAVAGYRQPVDTTNDSVTATASASPAAGDVLAFTDAKGTWDVNKFILNLNGKQYGPTKGTTITFGTKWGSPAIQYNGTWWVPLP